MKGAIILVALIGIIVGPYRVISLGIYHGERHMVKRHLTPLGSIIRDTAGKIFNPLGVESGSTAQSHSFSIGGSFLGIGGSLSTSSSKASSFGGGGTSAQSQSSGFGSGSQFSNANAGSSAGAGGGIGGSLNSQAQSSAAANSGSFGSNSGSSSGSLKSQSSSQASANSQSGGFSSYPVQQPAVTHLLKPIQQPVYQASGIESNENKYVGYEMKPVLVQAQPSSFGDASNVFSNSQAGSSAVGGGLGGFGSAVGAPIPVVILEPTRISKKKLRPHRHRGTKYQEVILAQPVGIYEGNLNRVIPQGNPVSNAAGSGQGFGNSFQGTSSFIGGLGGASGVGNSASNSQSHSASGSGSFPSSSFGGSHSVSDSQSHSASGNGGFNNGQPSVDVAIQDVFGTKKTEPTGVYGIHSPNYPIAHSDDFGGFGSQGSGQAGNAGFGGSSAHSSSQSTSNGGSIGAYGSKSSSGSQAYSNGASSGASSHSSSHSSGDALIFH